MGGMPVPQTRKGKVTSSFHRTSEIAILEDEGGIKPSRLSHVRGKSGFLSAYSAFFAEVTTGSGPPKYLPLDWMLRCTD